MTRIAIIGGGFSGTALAIQLLRRGAADLEIHLFNRSGPKARGLAYGTRSPLHVLNVPAGRMGLSPDDEGDFLRYLQQAEPGVGSGDFVGRSRYGDYLETRLAEAVKSSAARLHHHGVAVTDLVRVGNAWRLSHAAGALSVDAVVLATGNFAPATPPVLDAFTDHPAYVRDPWTPGALSAIAPEAPILLLGTGLTMYDLALALTAQGHRGPLIALSRRGLTPQPHREHSHAPSLPAIPSSLLIQTRIRPMLRVLRRLIGEAAARGSDWRDLIAALRPVTPQLWQQLPVPERRRFLRHLQVYWDVHRHRAAPAIAEAIAALRAKGQLRIEAGRLLDVAATTDGLTLAYRPRGRAGRERLCVAHIINCTGPDSNVARLPDPLFRSLLAQGLIRPDSLGLGLDADDQDLLRGADGLRQPGLYLIGPMLRARDWEATAVPELRQQAARLAERLLATLTSRKEPA